MQTHPLQIRSHEPAADHTCASDRSAAITREAMGSSTCGVTSGAEQRGPLQW